MPRRFRFDDVLPLLATPLAFAATLSHGQCPQALGEGTLLPRSGTAMVYDTARGLHVLFGGRGTTQLGFGSTWTHSTGAQWQRLAETGPAPQSSVSMTFDTLRSRAVLFGGQEIWEWDGSSWRRGAAGGGPSSRIGTACAFDAARAQTLVFGGNQGNTRYGDTWAWNGSAWTRVSQTGPTARTGAAMAFDPLRQRVVLFGGFAPGAVADTWEWDGTAWMQVSSVGPAARGGHAMVFDASRSRVLLAGGYNSTVSNKEFWEWDGTAWTQLPAAPAAMEIRHGFAMSCDPAGRVLIFGGTSASGGTFPLPATIWSRQSGTWSNLGTVATPPARTYARMVWDSLRHRPLLYGGARLDTGGASPVPMNDLWTFADHRWAAVASAGGPARVSAMVVYDSARDRLVSFGGFNGGSYLQDTWELPLSGGAWTLRTPSVQPPARNAGASVYDPVRNRTIIHAGYNGTSFLTDTWEWDGSVWTQVASNGPAVASGGAMIFDPVRGVPLLMSDFGQVWLLNSGVWQSLATTGQSPSGIGRRLGFDADRGVVVAVTGTTNGSANVPHQVFELAGTVWTQRPIPAGYESRYESASVWNPDTRRMIVFGGYVVRDNIGSVAETWELDYQTPSPVISAHPVDRAFCPGNTVELVVAATSDLPATYRWRHDGVDLVDGPTPWGSSRTGSASPILTITGTAADDSGVYTCAVGSACGVVESEGADVTLGNCCPADFNLDGGVDGGDVEAFFLAWEAADPSGDMNADGGVDGADIEFFFLRWEAGC